MKIMETQDVVKKFVICVGVAFLAVPFVLFAGNAANPNACELSPIPLPLEFKSDMDRPLAFDASTTITLDCPDAVGAKWLADHFKAWYGKNAPKVVSGKASDTPSLKEGSEAYAIVADGKGVRISARSLAGVRWAAYTIRQIVIAKRGTLKTEGHLLPTLSVSDAPHLAFRGIHLCWLPEMRPQQIERAIRLAAMFKFNYIVLEPWAVFRSERHPWISWPEAKMTKTEIRRLVAVGRDLGVTLVPQFASLGHASGSRAGSLKHPVLDLHPEYEPLYEPGGWNWCISNPETQRVIRDVILELLEVFDHPPYIHLGCDEGQPPTCPECRKRPYGELCSEHIANLAAFAKEHGARAMIWGDMLLKEGDARWQGYIATGSDETARMVDLLPKDVVICDWQYGNQEKAKDKSWPSFRHFAEKGFPVVACPWENYWSMRPIADAVSKVCGFGFLETTWHHLRGQDWVSMYSFAAAAAWGSDLAPRHPQFDTRFAIPLQLVGRDMKLSDYRDTGHVNYQVPPSWWQP